MTNGGWTTMYGRVTQVGAGTKRRACERERVTWVVCQSCAFGFTNDIQTLKYDNFLVKHPFVIPFTPVRSL
jgi:hypothetical protein